MPTFFQMIKSFFFNLGDVSPFRGAIDTLVLDFWWHLPWVSKPGWIPCLRTSLPAHNRFLRFTSSVTPADCIESCMAAEPYHWWRFGAVIQRSRFGSWLYVIAPAMSVLGAPVVSVGETPSMGEWWTYFVTLYIHSHDPSNSPSKYLFHISQAVSLWFQSHQHHPRTLAMTSTLAYVHVSPPPEPSIHISLVSFMHGQFMWGHLWHITVSVLNPGHIASLHYTVV